MNVQQVVELWAMCGSHVAGNAGPYYTCFASCQLYLLLILSLPKFVMLQQFQALHQAILDLQSCFASLP